ncbi:MAG: leucine--tRNA ligase [Candidatus Gottesmanbacteria bacterium]
MTKYDPGDMEIKWEKKWEMNKLYLAKDSSPKPKKYILIEFPYPSGERLHVGHGRSYTALDALARKYRMLGFNVLYPIGWDAFGLPAENYAIKTGINPAITTAENITNAKAQAKRWGLSFDWSREINTTDPNYYKWTQWIFLQMFKKGLAYQAKVPVNWCPFCKTNLADEEVLADGTHERCGNKTERRLQSQWLLKITAYADRLLEDLNTVDYLPKIKKQQENWIGRSEGIEIQFPISRDEAVGYEFSHTVDIRAEVGTKIFGGTKPAEAGGDKPLSFLKNFVPPRANTITGLSKIVTQHPLNSINIFTTAVDTIFGATFMVLSPEYAQDLLDLVPENNKNKVLEYITNSLNKSDQERKTEVKEKTGVDTGIKVLHPFTGKELPVYVADYVLREYGTGAIMAVPAHDARDHEFAKKYGISIITVIKPTNPNIEIGDNGFWSYEDIGTKYADQSVLINSDSFNGLNSHEAKKKIGEEIIKREIGKKVVNFHLRDWVFSRQHYWGEPIPIVHCLKDGIVPVPEEQLPVVLPYIEKYQPTGTGESPLAAVKEWVNTTCPVCNGPAKRETDTMPNWAGSNWYYLAYLIADKLGNQKSKLKNQKETNIFIENKKIINYWMPVDLYNGGMEHTTLHLLYSRFIYKFLFDLGVVPTSEPYARRYSHGVVLGPDGQKMSKSRGNVINPDDVIKVYGADTFRLYEMFMGPFDQMIPWNDDGVMGCHRFLKRVWQLTTTKVRDFKTPSNIETLLNKTINKVSDDLEALKFNTAIASMMEFINSWAKPGMFLSKKDAKTFLQILAPFAPHITEELFHYLDPKSYTLNPKSYTLNPKYSIHQTKWPKTQRAKVTGDEKVTIIIEVNGRVRDKVSSEQKVVSSRQETEKIAQKSIKIKKYLAGKKIKQVIFVPGKLINFVV